MSQLVSLCPGEELGQRIWLELRGSAAVAPGLKGASDRKDSRFLRLEVWAKLVVYGSLWSGEFASNKWKGLGFVVSSAVTSSL